MTNCQCAVHANWRSEPKGAARKIRANGKEEETERRGDQRIVREKTKGIRAARKRGHATPWRRCRPFLFTKFDRLLEPEMHPSSNPSWKTKRAWCSLS